ncbi:MAG: serine/threonine-protein kinase [Polyangiaceae bacterium]
MSDTPLIGQTIAGRFKLTGFIGEGAMATVYRGLQEGEPRDVAVKIMHAHLARDPTFAARFRREAKAAALLSHPNTVHIVDYGADRDRLYIAMELISGQDLFEMLVIERRFSEARATRIVADVCDALSTAHARGIIHRDLKPENVMLIPGARDPRAETVKVLDFGIAKILERDKIPSAGPDSNSDEAPSSLVASALTTVGVVVGTPAYMSPEQCRAEPVDARSDVYSCGILLYQLICGRTPFTGDSPIEIAINQVRMPPDPPSSIIPSIHPQLEQILLKALEKWPAQRQQSAGELRDELRAVLPYLSEERKLLADGKQPPPPSVRAEDRQPPPPPAAEADADDLAATFRRGDEPPAETPRVVPQPPSAQHPIQPTLALGASPPASPAPRPSAPTPSRSPRQAPFSEPNRSEVFAPPPARPRHRPQRRRPPPRWAGQPWPGTPSRQRPPRLPRGPDGPLLS